jgi:hypothetical protein
VRRFAVMAVAVATAVFTLWVLFRQPAGVPPRNQEGGHSSEETSPPPQPGVFPDRARGTLPPAPAQEPGTSPMGNGPEIVLRDVAMREIREGGDTFRLRSEEATYSPGNETLSASVMTLVLSSEPSGEIVVRAGSAVWDLAAGRIVLPEGGSAERAQGWSAQVPEGSLDLRERVFRGGEATLAGPGVEVAGRDLVWRWEDDAVTLSSPRSRIAPAGLPRQGR